MEEEKKCHSEGCRDFPKYFYKDSETELFLCQEHSLDTPSGLNRNLIRRMEKELSQKEIQGIREGICQHNAWFSDELKKLTDSQAGLKQQIKDLQGLQVTFSEQLIRHSNRYIDSQDLLQDLVNKQRVLTYKSHPLVEMLLKRDFTAKSVAAVAREYNLEGSSELILQNEVNSEKNVQTSEVRTPPVVRSNQSSIVPNSTIRLNESTIHPQMKINESNMYFAGNRQCLSRTQGINQSTARLYTARTSICQSTMQTTVMSPNTTIQLNDRNSSVRQPVYIIQGNGPVHSVALTYDYRYLIYTVATGINIYDFPSNSTFSLSHNEGYFPNSIALRPSSQSFVSGGTNGKMALWDLAKQTNMRTDLVITDSIINCVDISKHDFKVAGLENGNICLVGPNNRPTQYNMRSPVKLVSLSSRSNLLTCSTSAGTLMSLNLSAQSSGFTMQETQIPVYSMCFSPDDSYILAGSDKILIHWDLRSVPTPHRVEQTGRILCMKHSCDGHSYYIGDSNGRVLKSDLRRPGSPILVGNHFYPVLSLCLNDDGTTVFAGDNQGRIRGWSTN